MGYSANKNEALKEEYSLSNTPIKETFDDFNHIIEEIANTPYHDFTRELIEFDL